MENTLNKNTDYAIHKLQKLKLISEDTKGLFLVRDCIITETIANESLSYHVYNYRTFEKKYLGYRKSKMTEEQQFILQSKVRTLEMYNTKIPQEGAALVEFIFREVFTQYGFCIRKDQVELAIHMYNAMMHREISMSDIPVGLGKTHAYLVAAVVYNLTNKRNWYERRNYSELRNTNGSNQMPIVITTSSIQLQKAIEKEYIPSISKMLLENGIINEPLTSVQRKGKENYICDHRLTNYVNTLNTTKKPDTELRVLKHLMYGNHIDLTEVKGITNYDMRKIHVLADCCYSCHQANSCRFQTFMKGARSDQFTFQICNHNYYFADVLRRKKNLKSLLPNYKAVIIDEAHKLVVAAEDMYGITFSKKELTEMILKAKPSLIKTGKGQSAIIVAKESLRLLDIVFEALIEQVNEAQLEEEQEKFTVKITSAIKSEMNRLRLNLERLAQVQQSQQMLLITGLNRIAKDIEAIISTQTISWLEFPNDTKEVELHTISKTLSKMIRTDLFSKDIPYILTSGTIAVEDDFSYFRKGLGLEQEGGKHIKQVIKDSPFDFYQNTIRYQSVNIPYPNCNDENYIEAIASEITKLIEASHGHALVLFTSYTPMKKVCEILKEREFDFPIFQLRKGRTQVINDFRSSNNGVLLACGSAWEGIDFKGDLLSHLIIVKLPFLVPDPITEEQQSIFESFENFKNEILIPRMLIRLKQGYGRAIRSEKDTAVISILDSRAQGTYKDVVNQALPKCRVTHDIEDVKQFFYDKKDPDYFTEEEIER